MTEFWEDAFADKQEMWGMQPAESAIIIRDFFVAKGLKNILIPGIGYGRNAQPFIDGGMHVTGIEISKTAIELASKHFGNSIVIHHGSVTDMPFDKEEYDGIFCYGLIHLLDQEERIKLIQDCYNQLKQGGYMVFTSITQNAETYGKRSCIGNNRFEQFGGVKIFFYNEETLQEEFGKMGLIELMEVNENFPFYIIKCQKSTNK